MNKKLRHSYYIIKIVCNNILSLKFLAFLFYLQIPLIIYYINNPNLFDKPFRMKFVDEIKVAEYQTGSLRDSIAIVEIIKKKNNKGTRIYSEDPNVFKKLFLNGYGNCANQSKSLGVIINEKELHYDIIHFIDYEKYYLGKGHSILRSKLNKTVVLLDPLAGGIVQVYGSYLMDHEMLHRNALNSSLKILNHFNPPPIDVYKNKSFFEQTIVGITLQSEQQGYYNFIKKFKLNKIPSNKYSQILIRGIAAFSYKLPSIYFLNSSLKDKKFNYKEFYFLKLLANAFLLILKAQILIIVFLFFSKVFRFLKNSY